MLFIVERYQLFSAFALLPRLKKEQLEKAIYFILQEGWIQEKEDGYYLTQAGKQINEEYFAIHSYPKVIQSLEYVRARSVFWERFHLLSQVFSEVRYENRLYVPIVKHPHHQEAVRIWLSEQIDDRGRLAKMWGTELFDCMKQLKGKAPLIVKQLAGHKRNGQTKKQVAEEHHFTPFEFELIFNDALESFIQIIKEEKTPLLLSLVESAHQDTGYGLTESTYQTARFLHNEYTIEEIARKRRLKVNTIKEHLLEIAFVQQQFDILNYVPKEAYKCVSLLLENNLYVSFSKIKEEIPDLEFFHYRLIQLERMRHLGA
jgi:ribulose-phosphate 3-epimerase